MTPEERFTRIESAIQAMTETQARHDLQVSGIIAQVEKQNDGIRDLIVVCRTLVDSQKETNTQIQELREAQRSTDDRLQALVQTVDQLSRTVDAFVKSIQKPNGNQ